MKQQTQNIVEKLSPAASVKILVVDDKKECCELLTKSLGAAGFGIETAESGKAALEKIEQTGFDLVLLDVLMPDMNGMEVLTEIRKTHSLIELPVLMVTAKTQTDSIVEAFELGANDCLTKPLDLQVVLARSKTHLTLKKTEARMIAALKKEKYLVALHSQFLTMASHEFRTPLTVIMAASDTLQRYGNRMQEEEKIQNLSAIQEQVGLMTELLDKFMITTEESGEQAELGLRRTWSKKPDEGDL